MGTESKRNNVRFLRFMLRADLIYLLLFFGTLFEGELCMLILGTMHFEAKGSYLLFVIVASLGAFLGDWFWFWRGCLVQNQVAKPGWLGRIFGRWIKKLGEFRPYVDRYPLFCLTFLRYQMYMRAWGCKSLGRTRFEPKRFVKVNFVACLIWALGISLLALWFSELYSSFKRLVEEMGAGNL